MWICECFFSFRGRHSPLIQHSHVGAPALPRGVLTCGCRPVSSSHGGRSSFFGWVGRGAGLTCGGTRRRRALRPQWAAPVLPEASSRQQHGAERDDHLLLRRPGPARLLRHPPRPGGARGGHLSGRPALCK